MYLDRRKRRPWGWILLAVAAAIAGVLVWAPQFERVAPSVALPDTVYVNGRSLLRIPLSDNVGLKSVRVLLKQGGESRLLFEQPLFGPKGVVDINLSGVAVTADAQLLLEAQDTSWWMLYGNKTLKGSKIVVDTQPPHLAVLANSYAIVRGGAALVVVEAKDPHLKELYLDDGAGHRFEFYPFVREGFYAALVAWPIKSESFRGIVEASDAAGNRMQVYVPFYLKNVAYRTSVIPIADKFIDGKISELAALDSAGAGLERAARFKFVNETIRKSNEERIYKLGRSLSKSLVSNWSIRPFHPLPNGQVVATYGDHRLFSYGGMQISESWHLGIDLASTQEAPIYVSNPGVVMFADMNGLYGRMPYIDHGLGLASLYGHCTTLAVKAGDPVQAGQLISTTGVTGLALGDHLHFGLVIQGYEVTPVEWMDARWIQLNITDILKQADMAIRGRVK